MASSFGSSRKKEKVKEMGGGGSKCHDKLKTLQGRSFYRDYSDEGCGMERGARGELRWEGVSVEPLDN